ncbi:MAG: GNAT family N-acetyltransferase [Flavobacteriales bacterium]|jgi:N-acetylglutamate synthase-like GNAT family acetyltransferase|nr:GNAT family N-acetyltransferase [Flavobacteriales bacterium]
MIRKYTEKDFDKVVQLLRLNTPQFFHPSEEKDFIHYLTHLKEDYLVVEQDNDVVGAGGINYCVGDDQEVRFSWDVVHPNYQGKGIGKSLVEYRIDWVKNNRKEKKVVVRTSQLATLFYQKFGFKLQTITQNFWAEGLDLYLMHLKL